MPQDPDVSKIDPTGLRYKIKAGGSPFGTGSTMATMSCYKCGQHKPRALGGIKKFLNQNMFVCGDCVALSPKKVESTEKTETPKTKRKRG